MFSFTWAVITTRTWHEPWNPDRWIGILISWLVRIPIYTSAVFNSFPILTANNQGRLITAHLDQWSSPQIWSYSCVPPRQGSEERKIPFPAEPMQQKELIPVGSIFWGLQFVILKTILTPWRNHLFIGAFYNSEDAAQRRHSPHHPPGYSKGNCPNYPSINSGFFFRRNFHPPISCCFLQGLLKGFWVANQRSLPKAALLRGGAYLLWYQVVPLDFPLNIDTHPRLGPGPTWPQKNAMPCLFWPSKISLENKGKLGEAPGHVWMMITTYKGVS